MDQFRWKPQKTLQWRLEFSYYIGLDIYFGIFNSDVCVVIYKRYQIGAHIILSRRPIKVDVISDYGRILLVNSKH